MRTQLPGGGYIEPDPEPRQSEFHRRIVRQTRISGTLTGNDVWLECGHAVRTFGDLSKANGVVLCTRCRDTAKAEMN
jgi:hypothetical protein